MDVRQLARDLVAIPSHEDETAAGDRVEEWLRAETDAVVARDDAGNVIARRRRKTGGSDGDGNDVPAEHPTLALVGHHDVVPPDDSQVDADGGYVVAVRDDRLHGRGSADMKGSLAAAMVAFRDADLGTPPAGSDSSGTPAPDLVFASFAGEERGGVGARAAVEDGFAPEWAVVCEGSTGYSAPGVTDVAVAHKGRRGSTLVARGKSAHASEPEAGENAVYRAVDAVDVVRELPAPAATVRGERVRGSLAVTGIEGGSAWNVVPERCAVTVDERTVPGDYADLARAEEVTGVEWTVDQDLPPMECGDDAFADAALTAARRAGAGDPQHVVKPHATDAGWLSRAGTECVVCGAAEPGEAHTADESVSLTVVERCARIYRDLAESFAPGAGTDEGKGRAG